MKKPLFISDLIQGFQSEDIERFNMAIECAEGLIRTQNANDLELQAQDFLQTIFRSDNKFDSPGFMLRKYSAIQAMLEVCPGKSLAELANRI